MHVIERTDRFTLVGSDARRGKLTLFDAEGPRERARWRGSACGSRSARRAALPRHVGVFESARLTPRRSSRRTDVEYDLDHVALRSPTRRRPRASGCGTASRTAGPRRVEVGGAFLELVEGDVAEPERRC
jgi:hypothetical protein